MSSSKKTVKKAAEAGNTLTQDKTKKAVKKVAEAGITLTQGKSEVEPAIVKITLTISRSDPNTYKVSALFDNSHSQDAGNTGAPDVQSFADLLFKQVIPSTRVKPPRPRIIEITY